MQAEGIVMSAYSVATAKNSLPSLIDKAISGEAVVITRHGKPVAELRAMIHDSGPREDGAAARSLARLRAGRDALAPLPMTSLELLQALYEDDVG
jgi:antitoxin (DNA-binding transcriptional repressor) of toxin-antitoxin stability system